MVEPSKPNILRTKEKVWFRGVFGLEKKTKIPD